MSSISFEIASRWKSSAHVQPDLRDVQNFIVHGTVRDINEEGQKALRAACELLINSTSNIRNTS